MAKNWWMQSIVVLLMACILLPAQAWGPKTELTMVSNAGHLLSKSTNLPMQQLDAELRQGAMISKGMLQELYPTMDVDPIRAIEAEMYLLRKIRGDAVDGYFAYRLGALGKLITKTTTPLNATEPGYQAMYLADVENNIQDVQLNVGPRKTVDPMPYFQALVRGTNQNNDSILREYKDGVGFQGVAHSLLSQDASRSVAAVADVWYTIFSGGSVTGGISQEQLREYVINALEFYVGRGQGKEVDAAAQRYASVVSSSPDMQISIGDHLFRGGFFERAIGYYEAVIALDPARQDVAKKIAEYYMQQGGKALEEERLEAAVEAYATALEAHPLHPLAESERLHAVKLIMERDERQEMNRMALAQAEEYESLATEEAQNRHYAESFVLLRQAREAYSLVSNEFPMEHQKSVKGMHTVRDRMTEMKDQLVANAQQFSGTGFGQDAQQLARTYAREFDEQTLKAILENAYTLELKALERTLQDSLRIQ